MTSMVINTTRAQAQMDTTPLSHNSHPNSIGTNSSMSNSPYTSPSLVSPIYETSQMSISGPAEGYWHHAQNQNLQAAGSGVGVGVGVGGAANHNLAPPPLQAAPHLSPNPYHMGINDLNSASLSTDQYATTYPSMMNNQMGYDTRDLSYMANQPQQDHSNQGPGGQGDLAGRYIFQPDGTQLYVPYSYEQ